MYPPMIYLPSTSWFTIFPRTILFRSGGEALSGGWRLPGRTHERRNGGSSGGRIDGQVIIEFGVELSRKMGPYSLEAAAMTGPPEWGDPLQYCTQVSVWEVCNIGGAKWRDYFHLKPGIAWEYLLTRIQQNAGCLREAMQREQAMRPSQPFPATTCVCVRVTLINSH